MIAPRPGRPGRTLRAIEDQTCARPDTCSPRRSSLSWTAAACTKKSENPLSPSVAGPIAGVSITAPKLLEPQHQQTMSAGAAVTLLFESATTNGERPITQELQVALDPEFTQRVHSVENLPPGQGGRTAYTLPVLQEGRGYFWRVRAVDGANTGPYSPASIFQVALSVRIETPVPLAPVRREVIAGVRPTLVAQNTAVTGTTNVTYRFEVAADQGVLADHRGVERAAQRRRSHRGHRLRSGARHRVLLARHRQRRRLHRALLDHPGVPDRGAAGAGPDARARSGARARRRWRWRRSVAAQRRRGRGLGQRQLPGPAGPDVRASSAAPTWSSCATA